MASAVIEGCVPPKDDQIQRAGRPEKDKCGGLDGLAIELSKTKV